MKRLIAWGGAALFVIIVVAVVFRVSRLKALVTGMANPTA